MYLRNDPTIGRTAMATAKALLATVATFTMAACVTRTDSAASGLNKTGLANTNWKLVAISLDDVWLEPQSDHIATLSFEEDRLNGDTGCNSFFGEYAVNGQSLRIGDLGISLADCPTAELANQETALLDGIENVRSFAIDGDTLTLVTGPATSILFRKTGSI